MKPLRLLIASGTLLGGLTACGQQSSEEPQKPEAPAAEEAQAPAPSSAGSAHFETVVSHLDVGGTFLGYVDVDGDLDKVLEIGQNFLDTLRAQGLGNEIPDIQVKDLVSELGLQDVTAMGASSQPLADGRYRNQGFIHTPEGPKGLLTLIGTEAKPLETLKRAPSGTDVVLEQEFDLSALKEVALAIYEQLPKDLGIPPLDQMLQQPVPMVGMTAEQVIDQAKGRAIVIAKFDPEKKIPLPTGPNMMQAPAFELLIELQGLGWVFEKLQGFIPAEGPFVREDTDEFTKISVQIPPEVPFSFFQPVLVHDKSANKLVLASHAAFLDACQEGAGDKLGSDSDFKAVSESLPDSGNTFTYISPRVKAVVSDLVAQGLEQEGAPQEVREFFEPVLNSLDSLAGVTAVKANGIHTVSNASMSFKDSFVSGTLIPMAGLMVGSTAQKSQMAMEAGARAREEAIANAAAAQGEVNEAVAAGDQMDGMKKTVAALRLFATGNNGNYPDTLADLTPKFLSEAEAETALQWRSRSGPAALVYFSGLTVASEGNPIILASPEPDASGQRAVAHIDGTTETVSEDDFFKLARAALEQAN